MSALALHPAAGTPGAATDDGPGWLLQGLQGGTGNQLFQLAALWRLAARFGLRPAVDLSSYGIDAYGRKPQLSVLWPEATVLAREALPAAATRRLAEAVYAWPEGAAEPPALLMPAGVQHLLLDGYWQDHRYVDDATAARLAAGLARHAQRLAADPPTPRLGTRLAQLLELATPGTIALHLRRHDYLHHGVAELHFYLDALQVLRETRPALRQAPVLVFSDEPNAITHWLHGQGIAHRLAATGDDLLDLHLLAQCGAHVIGNSTWSWWGARLSPGHGPGQPVIWPAPWSLIHEPSPQLCPPHWIAVPGAVRPPERGPDFKPALRQRLG